MGIPKYNHSKQMPGHAEDKSGTYADNAGQILYFEDPRNPSNNHVSFIAFLNSFSQGFTSNWNTEEVYGRMDPISTFKNTTRTISVAWDLPAESMPVAKDNLNRCNGLISMLYPSYAAQAGSEDNALAMSKPPLIRMQYANLICDNTGNHGLLGFITTINWAPVLEMGHFHTSGNIYPKVIQLSVEFQVLHEHQLGYNENNNKMFSGSDPSKHLNLWPFKK